MRQEMQSNKEQAASIPQRGNDPMVDLMTKYKIPLTRQNYLDLAYFGDVPKELSAEQELELPERFRKG